MTILLDGQFPIPLLLVTPLGLLLSMASPDCNDTCMNRITGYWVSGVGRAYLF